MAWNMEFDKPETTWLYFNIIIINIINVLASFTILLFLLQCTVLLIRVILSQTTLYITYVTVIIKFLS